MDPKTLFVDIQDVRRIQEQVAGNSNIPEESLASNNNSNTTDISNVNELGSEIDECNRRVENTFIFVGCSVTGAVRAPGVLTKCWYYNPR